MKIKLRRLVDRIKAIRQEIILNALLNKCKRTGRDLVKEVIKMKSHLLCVIEMLFRVIKS